jgi:transposase
MEGRRRKRFLSPSEKYEIWIGLLRGEYTTIEAAERAGVDRTTIMRLRQVAKQGALEALSASRPGVRVGAPDPALAEARAEIARLSEALTEMGVRFDAGGGKRALGLSGRVPRRVDAGTPV